MNTRKFCYIKTVRLR